MFTKAQLDQLQKLFDTNNKNLETSIHKEINTSEERLEQHLTDKLCKKIDESQLDTIKVLTEVMHSGYNNHELRINRIENHLDLTP